MARPGIEVSADWQGRPMAELMRLVDMRQTQLGEDARYSLMATAMNVLKSLRVLTRKARTAATSKSFTVSKTPYVASWERIGGTRRRVVRDSVRGRKVPVYPVNRAGREFVKGERVWVWKIEPKHGRNMTWEKNRNKGAWYVFALSKSVAVNVAKKVMGRALRRESGMADTALAYVMHALHRLDGGKATGRLSMGQLCRGARASSTARRAASAEEFHYAAGGTAIRILSRLRYAKDAIKGGDGGISLALMRAANKTATVISHHWKTNYFNQRHVPVPFPEIVGRR